MPLEASCARENGRGVWGKVLYARFWRRVGQRGGSLKPSDLKMKKIEKKTCFLLNRPAITALRLVFNSDHFDVSCRKKTVRAPSFLWPICHVLTTPGTRDAGYDKSSS